MGTVFSFDLRTDIDPAVLADAVAWLHWVDSIFSTYRPGSEISRLADHRTRVVDCVPEVAEILALCERLRSETDGYFDAWAGGTLDPSGAVKGWAVDVVDRRLRKAGSRRHCINAGGDIRCTGRPGVDEPWRLGIADPIVPGRLVAVVEGYDFALATSGTAERGQHIVDPHTRRPPSDAPASVSLIGAELTTVDAFATATFAMGAGARAWLDGRDGTLALFEALVVGADGDRRRTAPQSHLSSDSGHHPTVQLLGG